MNFIVLIGAAVLASAAAQAQNTAVINQQAGGQNTSVMQSSSGNTSVVSQSTTGGNRAVISQSGGGNMATINQGGDSATGQSVSVSQSGGQDTVINQTNGTNSISIQQGADQPPRLRPWRNPKAGKESLEVERELIIPNRLTDWGLCNGRSSFIVLYKGNTATGRVAVYSVLNTTGPPM